MAWDAVAPSPTNGQPPRPTRRSRALVLLLLAQAVSGCETLERMDYWDRLFDPSLRRGPVVAMEPIRSPGDQAPAMDGNPAPASVVALDPVRNPGDLAPATNRNVQSGSSRAMEPRSNPSPSSGADAEARTRQLVRQNPWLTRFWMELTPAQRAQVERRLQRGNVRTAAEQGEPAATWDPMGLADRAALVFGGGRPPERSAPMERRDGSVWASSP
jgi:hypothetical protein